MQEVPINLVFAIVFFAAASAQFAKQFGRIDVVVSQQHQAMIPQVRHFVQNLFAVVVFRSDDRFCRFFANFFQDLILPGHKEITGIRFFAAMDPFILNNTVQLGQYTVKSVRFGYRQVFTAATVPQGIAEAE